MRDQVFSHYRIRDQLGSGGMGVVYRAEDLTLRREVAVNFLPATLATNRRMIDRFRREARAAAALNHPNICTIYEAGEQDGQAFIVMELLEGQTLQQYLAAAPPTVTRVLDIATQVAAGLGAAHAKGIIHRDIKPANIYVAHDGRIKILDFGIAKLKAGFDAVGQHPEDAITVEADQPTGEGALVERWRPCPPNRPMANRWIRGRICFRSAPSCAKCAPAASVTGATWAVVVNGILSETPPTPSIFADGIRPSWTASSSKRSKKIESAGTAKWRRSGLICGFSLAISNPDVCRMRLARSHGTQRRYPPTQVRRPAPQRRFCQLFTTTCSDLETSEASRSTPSTTYGQSRASGREHRGGDLHRARRRAASKNPRGGPHCFPAPPRRLRVRQDELHAHVGQRGRGEALSGGADSLIPIYLSLGFAPRQIGPAPGDVGLPRAVQRGALSVTQLKSLSVDPGQHRPAA